MRSATRNAMGVLRLRGQVRRGPVFQPVPTGDWAHLPDFAEHVAGLMLCLPPLFLCGLALWSALDLVLG
ncbi:hypothetical protein HHL28_02620 [Aerophototrophica crusticola]|uniref:Uncharacterized protein n=1 Tax=Aerophototrophica crusticola TaxID=1709002 RepID=A0A858R424_9PROT|nr:hypothetical protein HHL28_02620 [Rhodospirillaceae bacterium B3]